MTDRSLVLSTYNLAPATEWQPEPTSWWFLGTIRGEGYAFVGSVVYCLEPSGLLVVPPNVNLTLRASQLSSLTITGFRVIPDQLGGVVSLSEGLWLADAARRPSGAWLQEPAQSHAVHFHQLIQASSPASAFAARFRLLGFAAAFWEDCLSPVPAPGTDTSDAVARFTALVDSLTPSDLAARSSAELAAACGCCERHFTRLFRQRFGRSLREHQVEHRLIKARDLLRDSSAKIIDVALESGFRHLGLFNAMFKRRFGTTPSGWRAQRAARKSSRRSNFESSSVACWVLLLLGCLGFSSQAQTPSVPAATAKTNVVSDAKQTNSTPAATFDVRGWEVDGNTLLKPEVIAETLDPFATNRATFETLRSALTALQLTYRSRGWVTVSVGLPPQQLTNGIVKVAVTEGRLTDIQVVGNRYYSSNNILSALPSLHTNEFLNSAWFQPELDAANANRDRQIYPVMGPGPDPGTTALTLKVKDRLPLHGKLELNNLGPVGTPPLRINANMEYNNLWQLDHQLGVQYNFSPEEVKTTSQMPRFWNEPADVAYSAFYRLPLGPPTSLLQQPGFRSNDFGYDPVTRRFNAPPPTGRPELIVFASRSDNDTTVITGPLIPIADTPLVQIASQATGEDLTINEGAGGRLSYPLPRIGGIQSGLSFGPDWKHYAFTSYNTNTFFTRITTTNDNEPIIIENTTSFAQPVRTRQVDYLPLSLGWSGSWSDRTGATSFSINQAVNVADLSSSVGSGTNSFIGVAPAGHYYILRPSLVREQRLGGDWTLSLRGSGQWANQSLINNEQYPLGGTTGVRGYPEGSEYGDSGWVTSIEPRTPYYNLGSWDGKMPMRIRFSVFSDYGQRYLINAAFRDEQLPEWGAGLGTSVTIGEWFEARLQFAWALLDAPQNPAGSRQLYFTIGAQF